MDPERPFALKPGDILAEKFRIEQVLGIGGMGVVAAAWHLELRTRVALKLLLPSALLDEAAVERFSREAAAVARMRSEHVVRVFDVGTLPDGGPPYIVMEHLEGEDLEALLLRRGGRVEVEEAVGFIMQACEGAAEAHSLGIIHRDLKPANLFLAKRADGTKLLKVVDFGIAKERGPASPTLTGPLIAMGSPQYMSPEQTRASKDIDWSTDIWSLGVCLYEMLVGTPPFDAPSVAEITAAVLINDPQPLEERQEGIPAGLAAIVMRCLQKMPGDRYADVAALAEALEEYAPKAQRGAAARMRLVLGTRVRTDRRQVTPPAPETASAAIARPAKRSKRSAVLGALALGIVGLLVSGYLWRASVARRAEASVPPSATASASAPGSSALANNDLPPIGIQSGTARPATSASPRASSSARRGTHPGKRRGPGIGRVFPDGEPDPEPEPAVTSAPATAPSPAVTAAAPRFTLASARVEVGSAVNTFGTTATNVNRVIAPLASQMTACYRTALPQMPDPVAGSGTLHIETDDDGVIIVARVGGGVTAPGGCIAGAVSGRRLPNVDTGRARADVPLAFKAQ